MTKERRAVFFTGSSVVWGAELSLLTLAANSDVRVHLVTSNPPLANAWRASVGPSVEVVKARSGRLSRMLGFVGSAARAAWNRETVIVFDFYLLPLFALLRPIFTLRGGRIVVDVHDAVRTNPRRRPYFFLMRVCDLAICISEYIADQVDAVEKAVIYRPVESAQAGVEPPGTGIVGIVGQISPDKGTEFAVRAAAAAGVSHVVLRGLATEANQPYLEEVLRTAEHELGAKFTFEGRVPREQTMSAIDVLALTNADEPFGRVAAEAQLAGVVVVGPNEGGIAEIVQDGITGYAYPSGDLAAFAQALTRAANAPQSVRDRARAFANHAFDPVLQSRSYMRSALGI
ncbi:glycosyltransferase family 4 protein [Microbacterium sp. BG28]|uniref:glycosyltransferase family 4 protein n=1 Tax=Microbacterium sp. BG28 TaxID=3097356 RepID=UPI002A59BB21|nr:glycosyltransferase family 4 protein [Microbacterium sp. BG28]MDY0830153.1 glycosyltransferase family 4 protein [Microbacterium sp. BG28]